MCSDATVNESGEVGDPTETALVHLGEDHGFDEEDVRSRWPRLAELPFDSDRKLMSTVHKLSGGYAMVTKGAVDVLMVRHLSPGPGGGGASQPDVLRAGIAGAGVCHAAPGAARGDAGR